MGTVTEDRRSGCDESERPMATVVIYWIPLGAGASVVRASGKVFEAVCSMLQRRHRSDLYHSALEVSLPEGRTVIEMAPVIDRHGDRRGASVHGPVGLRWLGWIRIFRYEVRCWKDGLLPDAAAAVGGPIDLVCDIATARRVIDQVPSLPTPTWGRDELGVGEMWNSNSVTSWLLARAGVDMAGLRPPQGGRAPGWDAGLAVAAMSGVRGGTVGPTPVADGPLPAANVS